MSDTEDRIRDAPTVDELAAMMPSMDDYDSLTEWAEASKGWYNEAPWTAARLFVEAAEQSDEFRESFVTAETREETVEFDDAEDMIVEVDAWREVMEAEMPTYYEKLMRIGLSSFQGQYAERMARSVLEGDDGK